MSAPVPPMQTTASRAPSAFVRWTGGTSTSTSASSASALSIFVNASASKTLSTDSGCEPAVTTLTPGARVRLTMAARDTPNSTASTNPSSGSSSSAFPRTGLSTLASTRTSILPLSPSHAAASAASPAASDMSVPEIPTTPFTKSSDRSRSGIHPASASPITGRTSTGSRSSPLRSTATPPASTPDSRKRSNSSLAVPDNALNSTAISPLTL